MTKKPWMKDFLWIGAGTVMLLALVLALLFLRGGQGPSQNLARKVDLLEQVNRIRLAMSAASEAEKSAVMAITDEESQAFADQARAATAEADQECRELKEILAAEGTVNERKLLDQFLQVFSDLKQIDADLLALAVKNTNLKASSLAFGPAAAAVREIERALDRLVVRAAASADAAEVLRRTHDVQTAVLHIQVLFPPHIAEESDQKMDELEGQMAKEEQIVRANLDALAKLPVLKGTAELAAVETGFTKFREVKARILALSRENTNVRSLAISLTQKRKTSLLCSDALVALQQALQEQAGSWRELPCTGQPPILRCAVSGNSPTPNSESRA